MTEEVSIPNKSFFILNEVSSITGVKPYVLRFWETEFQELLSPVNSESGQKLYSGKDIEAFLLIKKVLFEEKIPIAEAKLKLKSSDSGTMTTDAPVVRRLELSDREIAALYEAKALARQMVDRVNVLREKYQI